jgi:hypothetical protein
MFKSVNASAFEFFVLETLQTLFFPPLAESVHGIGPLTYTGFRFFLELLAFSKSLLFIFIVKTGGESIRKSTARSALLPDTLQFIKGYHSCILAKITALCGSSSCIVKFLFSIAMS